MNLKRKERIYWIAFLASVVFHGLLFVLFKVKNLEAIAEPEYMEVGLVEAGWSEPFLELPGESYEDQLLFERTLPLKAEMNENGSSDPQDREGSTLPQIKQEKDIFINMESFEDKKLTVIESAKGMSVSEVAEKPMIQGPASKREVLFKKYPDYPLWAQRYGLEFEVRLKFWLTSGGDVDWVVIEASSGYPEVDAEVMRAMKRWRFNPVDGNERQWGTILFKFRLRH